MPKNTADSCMFCGANPCECNKPAKKAAVPRVKQVKPVIQKLTPSVVARPTKPALQAVARVRDQEKAELGRAITVFADLDMLHRDELEKHRDIIDLPRDRIDAMIWRQDVDQARKTIES